MCRLFIVFSLIVGCVSGCGDDSGAGPGEDNNSNELNEFPSSEDNGEIELTPPERPQLVDWTCPENWLSEMAEDEVWSHSICQPPVQVSCSGATAQFLGDLDCQPVGTACPSGADRFLTESEIRALAPALTGEIIYVDSEAITDGANGSRETPYGTLNQGILHVETGGILALAPGIYRESIWQEKSLGIIGSCPGETQILAPSPGDATPAIYLAAPEGASVVSNLSLTGEQPGIWISGGTDSVLSYLVIEEVITVGIIIQSGTESISVNDVVVRDTQTDSTGTFGYGILAQDAGEVHLNRVVLERNRTSGLLTSMNSETEVILLDATDLVIRDTGIDPLDESGIGITALGGSEITLNRALIEGNREAGISVGDPWMNAVPAVATLNDVAVRGTRSLIEGYGGRGIQLRDGSSITASQLLLEENQECALMVAHTVLGQQSAELNVSDFMIRNTFANDQGQFGFGLAVQNSGNIQMSRGVIERNRMVALASTVLNQAMEYPYIELNDVVISNTQSDEDGKFGRGLSVGTGETVRLIRTLFSGNRDISLAVFGQASSNAADQQTTLTAEHLTVEDTLRADCGYISEGTEGSCIENGMNNGDGAGVLVADDADVSLSDFLIEGAEQAGFRLRGDPGFLPQVDLQIGAIVYNAIGVNIEVEAYHTSLTYDEVYVYDNISDVSRSELHAPDLPNIF
jgi:hypothetical protein